MKTRTDHSTSVRSIGSAAVLCGALAASAGAAGLVAYEPFSYGASANIQFANGGSGWASPWNKLSQIPTGATQEGLAYPGLQTDAGSAFTAAYPSADYTRYSRVIGAYGGDDVYVSFLIRPNVGYGVGGGLAFGTTWESTVIVGIVPGTGLYGVSAAVGPASTSSVAVAEGQTTLVVLHAHKLAGGMIAWSVCINPTIGAVEPQTPEASIEFPGTALPPALNIFNDGGFSTDEIRVGTTWASVLPGTPGICAADLNQDAVIDGADITVVLGNWGTDGLGDIDGNGVVDGADVTFILGNWGEVCD